jgi:hypothetical protein
VLALVTGRRRLLLLLLLGLLVGLLRLCGRGCRCRRPCR